ncbi:MAG: 3-methyl-2-oxobutanoate hydroxymethyltransferase [Proteobacteria bacterium]|nr:3-methyl-2-oxobutanoate hydroxymethyltransferase [Pseudomonadota bacterium]MBU1964640.1 3-methyl-2-oxobutanoate hydroxymethyltransferase [Pseudomonadota bacterium]MBU4372605.1 3-methyl-2-oxobutanoate hydroxymethyltransferase [Pseudomonadota bacterium]MBU4583155.1 3-methyl-2-oxobutanoate hydroxymethyltransferase [Pseudomonadota bacterium]MCG2738763.1 3-methyl-2-oxobutanoate hydroxymethyltransferase [Syntrophaceae bacterium]
MAQRTKVTIPYLREKKAQGKPITMLTAYDFPFAGIEEEIGIDMILCGDSLGMTVYGFSGTTPVTMELMIPHSAAVKRAAPSSFVIGDMPFMSYQVSNEMAVLNAGRFLQESGVDGVKLEGGEEMAERIRAISRAGISVMGHIGLTPQSVSALGGFKAQGKDVTGALKLINDARILEESGAFSLLLEAIPSEIGRIITERAGIPTIGIGAGPHTDGQVLVVHDALGFFKGHKAKFVKQYCNLNDIIRNALQEYQRDVENRDYPAEEHGYGIDPAVLEEIKSKLK